MSGVIFVMGGAYQGKLEFAYRLLGQGTDESVEGGGYTGSRVDAVADPRAAAVADSHAALCADGHVDPYDSAFEKKVVYGLHAYVRRLLSEERPVEPFLEELAARNPDAVVVTDEVGCGIVPADPFERMYREAVGRASARLAAECGSVYRVLCGIGMKIK